MAGMSCLFRWLVPYCTPFASEEMPGLHVVSDFEADVPNAWCALLDRSQPTVFEVTCSAIVSAKKLESRFL